MKMKNKSLFRMILSALFAALTAVAAQISIPIGPVPISLATLGVYLAGAVLGAGGGAGSQAAYLLLGAAGVPVFAGFRGGVASLAGPTGGYLAGYAAAAWLVGQAAEKFGRKPRVLAGSMAAGLAVCYFLGTGWFMIVTGRGLWDSLALCVFPFLLGDALKIAVATALAARLGVVYDRLDRNARAA